MGPDNVMLVIVTSERNDIEGIAPNTRKASSEQIILKDMTGPRANCAERM